MTPKQILSYLLPFSLLLLGLALSWLFPPSQTPTEPQDLPDLSSYPWIYLSQDHPPEENQKTIELILVGDIFLDSRVPDPSQALDLVAPLLRSPDMVSGHHPHVIQEYPVIHPSGNPSNNSVQLVAYSLGNSVFDQQFDETAHGLALRVFIDENRLPAVQALAIAATPKPRLMPPESAEAFLLQPNPPVRRIGFVCHDSGCEQTAISPTPASGRFRSGTIDLTGDGVDEEVHLSGNEVSIIRDGAQVWQSPQEWQVLDLALGDPNDDGRGELLLALLKADEEGLLRSHPFIVGYRGGIYRLLWGGSAVSAPILEVELGDVNGDQVQELILIEDLGKSEGKCVSVWRWHGWGFSQLWRSQPASYYNLTLSKGESNTTTGFSVVINRNP